MPPLRREIDTGETSDHEVELKAQQIEDICDR
jgi:hypothetical protein